MDGTGDERASDVEEEAAADDNNGAGREDSGGESGSDYEDAEDGEKDENDREEGMAEDVEKDAAGKGIGEGRTDAEGGEGRNEAPQVFTIPHG